MNMGHHALPTVRRNDESLVRYVRSEYGETDACWLTSSAAKGSCLRLPGESVQKMGTTTVPQDSETHGKSVRCCPVMGALSDKRMLEALAPRGELAGKL